MTTTKKLATLALMIVSAAGCVELPDPADGPDERDYGDVEPVERPVADDPGLSEGQVIDAPAFDAPHRGVQPDPYELTLHTSGKDNAGTGATVRLTWIADFEKWSCTIQPKSKDSWYSCVPEYQGFTADTAYFEIENPSTDGLHFTSVWALTSGTQGFIAGADQDIVDTFHTLCTDCSGPYCAACWVDRDKEDCGEMRLGAESMLDGSHSYSCRNP